MAEPEPPRRNYALKPKTFTSLNAPPGTGSRIDVHDHLAAANRGPSAAGPHPSRDAEASRIEPLRETKPMAGWIPRRSRRRRDYWLLALSGGAIFALAAHWAHSRSAVLFTCVLSVLALYQAGLAWIMWQIMDDY